MQYIYAEFSFEIGCVPSGNSSDPLVHKGQREATMATNFGTKIAINAFFLLSYRRQLECDY